MSVPKKIQKRFLLAILIGILFLVSTAAAINLTEYAYGTATCNNVVGGTCANLFNGNTGDYLQTSTGYNITMDYGAGISRQINQIVMWSQVSYPTYAPREFILWGSADNANFVQLLEVTNNTYPAARYTGVMSYAYNFTNPTAYRYYKVQILYSDLNGRVYQSGAVIFSEIDLKNDDDINTNLPNFIISEPINSSFTQTDWSSYNTQSKSVFKNIPIQYTDTTVNRTGAITNWYWSFGDGTTSIDQNPIKTYTTLGAKTTTLTTKVNNTNVSTSKITNVVSQFETPQFLFGYYNTLISTGMTTPANAFNRVWTDSAYGGNATYIGMDYGRQKLVNSIRFQGYYYDAQYSPQEFSVQGSQDGTTWNNVYTKYGNKSQDITGRWNLYESRSFNFSAVSFRYYRFTSSLWRQQSFTQAAGTYYIGEMDFTYSNPTELYPDFTINEYTPDQRDYIWFEANTHQYTLIINNTYTFTDTSLHGVPITNYYWDFNYDNITESTSNTATYTPTTIGTRLARFTINDGINGNQTKQFIINTVSAKEYMYARLGSQATASATTSGSPPYLFDGSNNEDYANAWYYAGATPQWIKMQYDSPVVVNEYEWREMTSYMSSTPRQFIVSASNDNINWVDLDNRTAVQNKLIPRYGDTPPGYNYYLGSFNNINPYTYYRLMINSTVPTYVASSTVGLSEIRYRYHDPINWLQADAYIQGAGYLGRDTFQDRNYYNQSYSVLVNRPVTFADATVGNPTSWQWDINGDGTAEYLTKNATYTFTTTGLKYVILKTSNGISTSTKYLTINVVDAYEYSYFYAINGGVATASVTSGGNANFLFDGSNHQDYGNAWYSATYPNSWVQLYYGNGETHVINQINILTSSSYLQSYPRQFNISASNDGVNFVELDSRLVTANRLLRRSAGSEYITYNFANTNSYKYYRLMCVESTPQYAQGSTFMISEILYKYRDDTDFIEPSFYIKSDGINGEISYLDEWGANSYYNDTQSALTGRQINFTDNSLGTPTSRLWNFGDGTTSIDTNPTKTYASPGEYFVNLSITKGTTTKYKTMRIYVQSAFEYSYYSKNTNSNTYGLSASATQYGNPNFPFDKTYSADYGNSWSVQYAGALPYIQLNYGYMYPATKRIINEMSIYAGGSYPAQAPRAFRILASDDGTNWVMLDNRTENSGTWRARWQGGSLYTWGFNNTVAYRYYRLQPLTTGDYLTISEMFFKYHDPDVYVESEFYVNNTYYSYDNMNSYTVDRSAFRGQLLQFVDQSIGNGLTHTWDLNGDNITESTLANPCWTYSALGTFVVNHTVTNARGYTAFKKMNILVSDIIEPRIGAQLHTPQYYQGYYSIYGQGYYSTGYLYNIADHNVNTRWWLNTAPPKTIIYDYGGATTWLNVTTDTQDWAPALNSYRLQSSGTQADADRMPRSWIISGSNTGTTTWTVLDTQTLVPYWGNYQSRTYNFTNTNPYRYYNITVTAVNTTPAEVIIPELNFFITNGSFISPPPVASFTMSSHSGGYYGKGVAFTDTSTTGFSPKYLWDFGDNSTSTLQNPTHWYSVNGTYNITLTVTNIGGNSQFSDTYSLMSDWDVGVKSWLHLNGTVDSTVITDQSGNTWSANNNAKISNIAKTGFGDGSLILDGASSVSTTATGFDIGAQNATIEIWFKRADAIGGTQILVSKSNLTNNGYLLYLANNRLTFRADQQSPASQLILTETNSTTDLNWHMAVVQKRGNTWNLYKDGSSVATSAWTGTVTSNNHPLRLGMSDYDIPSSGFVGNVDEFRYSDTIRWDDTIFNNPFNEYRSTIINDQVYPPAASFTVDHNQIITGINLTTTDTSTRLYGLIDWKYEWGDGTNSTDKNSTHIYSDLQVDMIKNYTILQTVTNSIGFGTSSKNVSLYKFDLTNVSVDFNSNTTSVYNNEAIQFYDTSKASPFGWLWDFGDGQNSTIQNPIHAYTTAGSKTVNLTIQTNIYGANTTLSKTGYISVTQQTNIPQADFSVPSRIGSTAKIFQFTDTSINNPTIWAWDFENDGIIDSTLKDASHQYPVNGNYTVNLTVQNAFGSNSLVRTDYIEIGDLPIVGFYGVPLSGAIPLQVQFTSTSTNETGWAWDFNNDGNIDLSTQNPLYTYMSIGAYSVRLNVTNYYGFNATVKGNYVSAGNVPAADFGVNRSTGIMPAAIQFTDLTSGVPTDWAWDFETDGVNDSFIQSPSFLYVTNGTKNITLYAWNPYGGSYITKSNWINVTDPLPPVANFTASPLLIAPTLLVSFTDTSDNNPTNWNWSFGDNTSSTLQSPTHAYSTEGNKTITLFTSNAWGNNSKTRTNYVQVLTPHMFTQQDIWQEGQYTLTFTITDATSGNTIPVVTIIDDKTQNITTSIGTGSLTESQGTTLVYFLADGYGTKMSSYIVDGDATYPIQLTPISVIPTPAQVVVYNVHQVKIRCLDYNGEPIVNMKVNAQGVESTVTSYSWMTDLLGINLDTVPLHNAAMNGTTGSDGVVVFMMLESVKYQLNFTSTTASISQSSSIYPKEDMYDFTFWTEAPPPKASTYITIDFWNQTNTTDPEYMDLGVHYVDTGFTTDPLTFVVRDESNTYLINQTSATPNNWNVSYPVLISRGTAYIWTITGNSTRWATPLTRSQIIRFEGSPKMPFDLGSEWNNWLALIIIFVIAFLFGRASLKYGVAIIPLLSLFFWYINWLQVTEMMIAAVVFFGVLLYIRFAEQESDI